MRITKEDLKIFFKYGYMEFDFKKAMLLYLLFEFPISGIICLIKLLTLK